MAMPTYSIFVLLACISPFAVSAATVDGYIQGSVSHSQFDEPASFGVVFGPVETLEQEDSKAIRAFGFGGLEGNASAQYSVNAYTGQLRLGFVSEVKAVDGIRGSASSFGNLALTETFRIVGSGSVTVGMSVSARWGSSNFGFDACVSYVGLTFSSACVNRESLIDGISGLISSELLKATFLVPDATDSLFDFTWFLQGGVAVSGGYGPSEAGFLDAMNTANIFVRTDGNVTATPVTSQFLSDPAFVNPVIPAPVPLPATGLLLATSLGGLAWARRTRGTDRASTRDRPSVD